MQLITSISLVFCCIFTVSNSAKAADVPPAFVKWLQSVTSWSAFETGLLANTPNSGDGLSDAAKANLVRFYLYTDEASRFSPDQLIFNNVTSLKASRYNPSHPTVFYIHGWSQSYNCSNAQDIKDAYIKYGYKKNIVLVDWAELSGISSDLPHNVTDIVKTARSVISFYKSVNNTQLMGRRVGNMIKFLIDNKLTRLEQVHVMGFSTGAHIAGWAGRTLFKTEKAKLPRITGLEPAALLFYTGLIGKDLTKNDAAFVDIVHTDMGLAGTPKSLGHANFFMNGGAAPQPGCVDEYVGHGLSAFLNKLPRLLLGVCSHLKAPNYYAISITPMEIPVRRIFGSTSLSKISQTIFGEHSSPTTRGYFYVALKPTVFSNIYGCT